MKDFSVQVNEIEVGTDFITSRVSGRGNRISPVCVYVCVSVCPCVSYHAHGYVCQFIMAKGLSGKRTVRGGNAGGT